MPPWQIAFGLIVSGAVAGMIFGIFTYILIWITGPCEPMWGLAVAILLPMVVVAIIGIALFIILPVKWAIVSAVLCVVLIGVWISMADNITWH
jgi:hypothetical protein